MAILTRETGKSTFTQSTMHDYMVILSSLVRTGGIFDEVQKSKELAEVSDAVFTYAKTGRLSRST